MAIAPNLQHRQIAVALEQDPYDVIIGDGSLETLGDALLRIGIQSGRKILLVSNPDVAGPYGEACLNALQKAGFDVELLLIEAGEDQKTLATVAQIHDAAFAQKLERSSLMLALGGGVVGDMTGFAAATWLRGIGVIQVPTTLLAMVDASIGGKTGVNHPGGKNLIGAFHQPRLVLIDPATLATLPIREFRAGLAEVVKYGVLGDPELFELLEQCPHPDHPKDWDGIASKQSWNVQLLRKPLWSPPMRRKVFKGDSQLRAYLRARGGNPLRLRHLAAWRSRGNRHGRRRRIGCATRQLEPGRSGTAAAVD